MSSRNFLESSSWCVLDLLLTFHIFIRLFSTCRNSFLSRRCRYSRVPQIRSLLGCAAPPVASDSYKYIFDEHYLCIDIVINWVGDGLALAFFHAVIGKLTLNRCRDLLSFTLKLTSSFLFQSDKAPEDNDEAQKTEWTNWCGTPNGFFSDEVSDSLWDKARGKERMDRFG